MTSPIDGRRPLNTRTAANPVARTEAKPELVRSNSAPGRLQSPPPAAKPVAQPAAQPAAQPVAKPVAQPAAKPVAQPVAKPVAQPVKDGMITTRPPAPPAPAAFTAGSFFSSFKDAVKGWHKGAVNTATQNALASGVGKFGMASSALGVAGGIFGIHTGVKNLVEGIKNGDGFQVATGALGLPRATLGTIKAGLGTAAAIESFRSFSTLNKVATAAIGDGSKLGKTLASMAAESVLLGKPLADMDILTGAAKSKGLLANIGTTFKLMGANVASKLGGTKVAAALTDSVAAAGTKVLTKAGKTLSVATDVASTATQAAKTAGVAAKGAGPLAKMAGRFAPGLNVGLAALDVGIAVKTIMDPKASITAKVTSGITALGSVAAATNIPIVSQVGAAVSLVSTGVGAVVENFGAIKEGVKSIFKGW